MTVTDPADLASRTLAELRRLAAQCATEEEAREVAARIRAFVRRHKASQWQPYPWQHPHVHPDGWVSTRAPGKGVCDERCLLLPVAALGVHDAWVNRGGRGTGKTDGAAHYINAHAEGPPCDPRVPGGHRFTIVAPTQADAVSSCATGVSGLQAINPEVVVSTGREGTIVRWPNGSVARLLGAHTPKDVDRARAWSNICAAWVEEFAAMNYPGGLQTEGRPEGIMDQLPFTLRLGPRPHMIVTTTPRNTPEVIKVIETAAVTTWGRTRDADQLPAPIRDALEARFGGTTLGRQELDGEVISDVEGALWLQTRTTETPEDDDRPGIDNGRVPAGTVGWRPHGIIEPARRSGVPANPTPPDSPLVECTRTVVGVDPAGGSTENGICVVGEAHGQAYTLADLSLTAGPDLWGRTAVLAAYEYGAVGIALERTYGGDQTEHVIATAAQALGLPMPAILRAPTQEGKKQRALPVQALDQQGRIHHVGYHAKLEGEQVTWVEAETAESPNRLDAWVHAVRYLLVRTRTATTQRTRSNRRPGGVSSQWGSGRR